MSTPWMPLYVRDYLADTEHLSTLEHGAYLLLIMHYWQRGGLPADDSKLARICRLSVQKWNLCSAEVAKFFDADWRHKRIDAELKKASEISRKRRAAGKKSGKVRRKTKRTSVQQVFVQPQSQPPCSTETSLPYVPRESENGTSECRVAYSEMERKTLAFEFAGLDVDAAIAELDRWCDRKLINDPIDRKNAIYGGLRKRHGKARLADDMASGPVAVTASPQLAKSRLTKQNGRANGHRRPA